jgi:serine/threonine protein kinase
MGVVYKAEDTKLERTVALKFLAAHLLNDDEAKLRFLREAKAAAALHHANICPVHEIDEADGRTFISMAFIEGETLDERIGKGPLPIKEALEIGHQIAKGLQAAHEKGIVHRDIKPANVLVAKDGQVTIMDFGLARLTEASRLTKGDQTMGTMAYMSPEQAQGMEVDHRCDIWSLGCVLYEMVRGQRPFQGQYDQALAYEIVHQEPEPLTGVRAGVPMELEFIVGECLAKDREDRTGAAQEVARKLRTLSDKLKSGHSTILRTGQMTGAIPATQVAAKTQNPVVAPPPAKSLRMWQALAAAAMLIAVVALVFASTRSPSPEPDSRGVRRFSLSHPNIAGAAISPDGRNISFVAFAADGTDSLWVRSFESETARELPGTRGVTSGLRGGWSGGWSPDSRSIVFGTGEQLKRVAIDGGEPTVLCMLPKVDSGNHSGTRFPFAGAAFSPDGERIVFSSWLRLWEIPARGGQPVLLFEPESPGAFYYRPEFLPNGGGSRFLIYTKDLDYEIWTELLDTETGERRRIAPGQAGTYANSGYILHGTTEINGPGIFAMPFSIETMSATGDSFLLNDSGLSASVSQDGTLVYLDGSSIAGQIVVRDRSGEVVREVGEPALIATSFSVSPDGKRAVAVVDGELWVYDLDRNVRERLTPAGVTVQAPMWSASGREVLYYALGADWMIQAADGSAEAAVWLEKPGGAARGSFSKDGRYVAYSSPDPAGGEAGIWYRTAEPDGSFSEPISWLRTPSQEQMAMISPDGKYAAYQSDESGRLEIYVRPFPEGSGKWLVSSDGGTLPYWSADGNELFYAQGRAIVAVRVSKGDELTFGEPQRLFESQTQIGNYAAFPDGQRFIMFRGTDLSTGNTVRIVENWDAPSRAQ